MPCLLSYRGSGRHVSRVPCVVVRVGAERVQVETVTRGRATRRWVEYKQLTPDPERTHELWPAFDAQMRAIRSLEEGNS